MGLYALSLHRPGRDETAASVSARFGRHSDSPVEQAEWRKGWTCLKCKCIYRRASPQRYYLLHCSALRVIVIRCGVHLQVFTGIVRLRNVSDQRINALFTLKQLFAFDFRWLLNTLQTDQFLVAASLIRVTP